MSYLNILNDAINRVSPKFIWYGNLPKVLLGERCFAYELYHQLRTIIKGEDIAVNGEIEKAPKGFKIARKYPDIVIHKSQSSVENQALAIEIKRFQNLSSKELLKDFSKLKNYLDLEKDGVPANFKNVAFVLIGASEANLIKRLENISLKKFRIENSKNDIISYLKTIGMTYFNKSANFHVFLIYRDRVDNSGENESNNSKYELLISRISLKDLIDKTEKFKNLILNHKT